MTKACFIVIFSLHPCRKALLWVPLLKEERWLKHFSFLLKFSILPGSWTDVDLLNHCFALHSDMLAVLSCFSFNEHAKSGKLD